MKIAKVVLNLSLDKVFDYLIPKSLQDQVLQGSQVVVPFGHSQRKGHILKITSHSDYSKDKLKAIISVCEKNARINPSLLNLG